MKIYVNCLEGMANFFEIEVKPADTVSDVKKAIETVHGPLFPAAQQILTHRGKILKDETTLEENNVVENSWIAIRLSKAKVSSSGASTASSPSVTQAQPAQTVATPQVSAPTVSVPEPTSGTATAAAPAAPPASTQTLFAGTTLESTTVQQILDMGGGRWDRDTVVRALRAAFNNHERAVEYLYSGIPAQAEIRPVAHAPSTGEQAANPQAQPQQAAATGGPNTNPLNLFPQGMPSADAGAGDGKIIPPWLDRLECIEIGDLVQVSLTNGLLATGRFQAGFILDVSSYARIPRIPRIPILSKTVKLVNNYSASNRGEAESSSEKPTRNRLKGCIHGDMLQVHLQDGTVHDGIFHDGIIIENPSIIDKKGKSVTLVIPPSVPEKIVQHHKETTNWPPDLLPIGTELIEDIVKIGASTASAPSVTQAQPAQTVATPQVSAPTVSVPEPTSGTATAAAPAAPPASTQTLFAGTTLESTTVQQILDMGGGRWDRDTVVRALRAAFNNHERAVEYLYSGIPAQAEIRPVAHAPSTGEQAANPQAQPQQAAATGGPNTNPLNLFPQAQPAQSVATPAGADESEDSDGSEDVFYDAVDHQPVPPLPIHQYRHQYSQDGFQLHGLPDPVVGKVVAVVGEKRIGKTTALRVMAGKLQPNLCRPQNPPSREETWETWEEIINRFTKPETRRYFERIRDEDLSVSMMEQQPGTDRELRDRTIKQVICSKTLGEPFRLWEILEKMGLDHSLLSNEPEHLTDEQFQRFAIVKTVLKHADSYVFDEPFTFLNLSQKARAAKVIKSVLRRNPKSYVFVAENDSHLLAHMDAYACHITGIPQKRGEVVGRPEQIASAIYLDKKRLQTLRL